MSETYKKITKDGSKVQVESAIRDGEGVKISTNYAKKSEVPTQLSQLTDDATHRLVTDTEKSNWNAKYSKPSGGIPASDLADSYVTEEEVSETSSSAISDYYTKAEEMSTFHPVGSLYMSTEDVGPVALGWTGTWTKLTGDAYLKIVTSSAGSLGGTSSDHKIPLTSMPNHTHGIYVSGNGGGNWTGVAGSPNNSYAGWRDQYTYPQGGGQPYYPYYFGVYIWRRTQ